MAVAYTSALCTKKKKLVFQPNYIEKLNNLGIVTIQDLVELFDDLTEAQEKEIGATWLMNEVSGAWLTQVDSGQFLPAPKIEKLLADGKFTVKACYEVFLSLRPVPKNTALEAWTVDFPDLRLSDLWASICGNYKQLVSVKLRTFYLKFINRAFLMNNQLAKFKRVSPCCSYGCPVPETFVHVFWDCPQVRPLWTHLIKWCKTNISKDTVYSKEACLLIGFKQPVLNNVVTIFKYHLYLMRLFRSKKYFDVNNLIT